MRLGIDLIPLRSQIDVARFGICTFKDKNFQGPWGYRGIEISVTFEVWVVVVLFPSVDYYLYNRMGIFVVCVGY